MPETLRYGRGKIYKIKCHSESPAKTKPVEGWLASCSAGSAGFHASFITLGVQGTPF